MNSQLSKFYFGFISFNKYVAACTSVPKISRDATNSRKKEEYSKAECNSQCFQLVNKLCNYLDDITGLLKYNNHA